MGMRHDRGQDTSKAAEQMSFASASIPARKQALLESIQSPKLKWTKSESTSSQSWRTEDSPLKPVDPCQFDIMGAGLEHSRMSRMGAFGGAVSRDYDKTKTETLATKTDLHDVVLERVSWERYSHWDRRQQVGSALTATFTNRSNPDESITISAADMPGLAKLFDDRQKQAKPRAA